MARIFGILTAVEEGTVSQLRRRLRRLGRLSWKHRGLLWRAPGPRKRTHRILPPRDFFIGAGGLYKRFWVNIAQRYREFEALEKSSLTVHQLFGYETLAL